MKEENKNIASFEEFKKIELRVGEIVSAEKVEKAEKLLKLKVNLGKETRQIVAGIAKDYSVEELIGRQIVVAVNLEPKTLMGIESQGMLLAAIADGKAILLEPEKQVPPGAQIT